jgi:hypothetical protein
MSYWLAAEYQFKEKKQKLRVKIQEPRAKKLDYRI